MSWGRGGRALPCLSELLVAAGRRLLHRTNFRVLGCGLGLVLEV